MHFASLLVYVDEGPEAQARVTLACEIARLSKAQVIGIAASMPDVPQVDPYAGGAMLGEALGLFRDIAEADVTRAETLFWDAMGNDADHAEWRVVASSQILSGDGGPRSDQIIAFAERQGAALIIAGGYGHARMREWVMGGVTHGPLDRAPVCLLLSH